MKTKSVRKRNWPACRLATGGRTAALLIGLAFGVGLTVPLHAAMIDDFEGPGQKWACGGGGCDYLGPTQAVGRLTFAGQFPPYGDNRDNVYWPASLPVGNLNGRTVELRMDLVALTGEDHFFLLSVQGEGGYYLVARSQDQIMLAKWTGGGGGHAALFHEEKHVKYENTAVVLTLAPVGDTLQISVRLLDKDNANAVLYERSCLDSPASDVGVLTNLPPGFTWVPDQGAPVMNAELAWAGVTFMGAGTPQPAEVVVDNLEYTFYPAPELTIERSVLLSWPANTAEEQIVLSAEALTGPWIPCLEPIFPRNGALCMAVPITHNLQWLKPWDYFRLVPGYELNDDFSEPSQPWPTTCFPDSIPLQISDENGALRIVRTTPGANSRALLAPVALSEAQSFLHADFAMSVDILDWDPAAANESIGLIARATPPTNCFDVNVTCYMGNVHISQNDVSIYANPPNTSLVKRAVVFDPEKAYRLIFSGAGNQLTLRLLDLGDLTDVVEPLVVSTDIASQGMPGLWINTKGGTFDITIDNYFVSGAKPSP